MEIRIQPIKFDASESLSNHIEKKVSKLGKVLESIQTAEVSLKVTKPESAKNKEADIRLDVPGYDLFASKTADSFEEAIDLAVEALEHQISKYKEKNNSK
jgi:putative sigma-54 modulation protein